MTKRQKRDLFRPDEFDETEERASKSQMKRDMTALQQLGEELAGLGDDAVRAAGLTPEAEDALLRIRAITKHEARRRHLQYVGRLMRDCDTARAREIVEDARRGRSVNAAAFHRLERLRDRLAAGDDELLQQLFDANPDQGQRLRQLTLAARRERTADTSRGGDGRALFRLLRTLNPADEES